MFKHLCPEWDYMQIDSSYPEIDCCLCYYDTDKEQLFKDMLKEKPWER